MNTKRLVLTIVIAVLMSSYFIYNETKFFLSNKDFISNSAIITGKISDIQKYTKKKKGTSRDQYVFIYEFTINNTVFVGKFETSENYAEQYVNNKTIEIAYIKDNPSKNRLKKNINPDSTIDKLMFFIIRFLLISTFFGFIFSSIASKKFGWGNELVNPEEDNQLSNSSKA